MSAWSAVTWCTEKGPREQTLSRPPAALSRQDLQYASVLASPVSTPFHAHVKPCSHIRPPSCLAQPQSSHAARTLLRLEPVAATPLQQNVHHTHLLPMGPKTMMPRPCGLSLSHSPSYVVPLSSLMMGSLPLRCPAIAISRILERRKRGGKTKKGVIFFQS
jgi:hypothetical protein